MNNQLSLRLCRISATVFSVALAAPVVALEPDQIFARVARSVFSVYTYDGEGNQLANGSAVTVAPGRVVTNCHVLRGAAAVKVRHADVMLSASLEFPDAERDLCQLAVDNLDAKVVQRVAASTLRVGQRVYAVGSPHGLDLTLSEGLVSALRTNSLGKEPVIQTSAAISHGSSGGGLFDTEGRLVGIVTLSFHGAQNLNFAVPVDWLAEVAPRAKAALKARDAEAARLPPDGGEKPMRATR